ncbi:MAG: 16S rRNA (guanine(527)-N(7))-methyltransferase RsmG [Thermomicrobium sp.]|nr:16S rRNA (guanine(527)-N(7))-methyltransferase RsmG [Thermomicrobium sp.]
MDERTPALELVRRVAQELGAPLAPEQERAFRRYAELLLEWNRRINLTGIDDWPTIERRLLAESIALLPLIDRVCGGSAPCRLIDVGTGAGIPGIPLAIVRPSLAVTLLDATAKKVRFLELVTRELGLTGARPIHERAETLAHQPEHRGRYDVAMARALAHLATALELTLPFLRVGGLAVFPKGPDVERELAESQRALEILGGELVATGLLPLAELIGTDSTVVTVRAVRPTPSQYPRRTGVPAKRPLR